MPDINQMRNNLYSAYNDQKWKNKVNAMSDNQVIAIWYSMNEKGKFDNGDRKRDKTIKDPKATQLPLFDI